MHAIRLALCSLGDGRSSPHGPACTSRPETPTIMAKPPAAPPSPPAIPTPSPVVEPPIAPSQDVDLIVRSAHWDPFGVLGPHEVTLKGAKALAIRAFLPA